MTMTPETAAALRAKFPPDNVGKLPKPYSKDATKGTCPECGQWHGLPAMHLDYVGHAAVTDRLLSVDPLWTWEPLAYDETGLPAYDRGGGLWIKLTVCGVTRLGYGDGPDPKQRIGDALRNAAMRFGVALDLWHRGGDLHDDYATPAPADPSGQTYGKGEAPPQQVAEPEQPAVPAPGKTPQEWRDELLAATTKADVRRLLRDLSMAKQGDVEVADDNGESLGTLTTLATARMREAE